MAELSPEEKDAISHRGRAARAIKLKLLEARGEGVAGADPMASLFRPPGQM